MAKQTLSGSSRKARRILIAGCGKLGIALGRRLVAQGDRVWGIRRNIGSLPSYIRPIEADLSHLSPTLRLPEEFHYIFFTASSDSRTDHSYRQAYVEAPRRLLSRLLDLGQKPERVFFTSSTGVFGQTTGEWVDENSTTRPLRFTGSRLLEGEELFRGSPFPSTVVRLGGIYGPQRIRLLKRVLTGKEGCSQEPTRFTNRIHIDDCAGVLTFLMDRPFHRDLYLAVDHEPAERCDVIRWMATQFNIDLPREVVSAPASSGNKRCSNRRLVEEGYRFRYPTYREGYLPLIELLKKNAL